MRRGLVLPLVLAGALLLGASVLFLGRPGGGSSAADPPAVELGGPFTLVDQNGKTVTERDFRGKPTVLFFGFTYCPEVCPTTLADLTADLKALGPDAAKLNVIYVTVDPLRDTQKQMRTYLTAFDPRIRGLTGTPAQIAQIAKEYDVYYQKVPLEGGSYTMDHSAGIYLIDRHGRFEGMMTYQDPQAEALTKLRTLIHS
jgi:protein SCO1/2